ncbi:Flp family type IVb pilin [Cupriavidus taiwanensis]|uniref:Flp family type IVb pilin n=1 Tax=Cupriavidus taiwanensis TaxID=164546 RepID=UPI0015736722|nr:Flp family type IVb pilin [Cupriavidus taiwanensis]NSX13585.1 Flp family type IVb pilin [Cupriavidus taiwanensis]
MKRLIARFIKDERGATAIEYGLIAGLVALAIVGTVSALGGNLNSAFDRISKEVEKFSKPATPPV